MKFSEQILVAIGDSFVYGHLGDDTDMKSCHQRSWVSKLEKLGNFQSSVNLGEPGGSNDLMARRTVNYLQKHYQPNKKYFFICGITNLNRFELCINKHSVAEVKTANLVNKFCNKYDNSDRGDHVLIKGGTWLLDNKNSSYGDYVEKYYNYVYNDQNIKERLNNNLFLLDNLLTNYGIDHVFVATCGGSEVVEINIPLVKFKTSQHTYSMNDYPTIYNIKIHPCGHYDHDGHEIIARYMLDQISIMGDK